MDAFWDFLYTPGSLLLLVVLIVLGFLVWILVSNSIDRRKSDRARQERERILEQMQYRVQQVLEGNASIDTLTFHDWCELFPLSCPECRYRDLEFTTWTEWDASAEPQTWVERESYSGPGFSVNMVSKRCPRCAFSDSGEGFAPDPAGGDKLFRSIREQARALPQWPYQPQT